MCEGFSIDIYNDIKKEDNGHKTATLNLFNLYLSISVPLEIGL